MQIFEKKKKKRQQQNFHSWFQRKHFKIVKMTESKPSSGISNMFNSVADKITHSIQQVPTPSAIQHSL